MSDESLIFAYLLDGRGGGIKFGWDDVRAWKPEDGVLWVHLDYSKLEAEQWMRSESCLSSHIVDILANEETRPRFLKIGEDIVIILRAINTNEGADLDDLVSLRIFASESIIISCRKRRLFSEIEIASRLDDLRGPKDSGGLLISITERIVERIGVVIADFEEQTGEIEEAVSSGEGGDRRSQLSDLRRKIIRLRRYLLPQREALGKAVTAEVGWLSEKSIHRIREVFDDNVRYLETLESARDQALVTHEELSQQLSEATGERMYLLAIVAAIFLPLSFITGLLGINVAGIPIAENDDAFLYVSGGLGLALMLELLLLRYLKWF